MSANVYFARCVAANGADMGAVKIGFTTNAKKRMAHLGSGQPYKCELLATAPGALFEEAALHTWLRPDALGGEFFRDSAEVRRLIAVALETECLPIAIAPNHLRSTWISSVNVDVFMARYDLTIALLVKHAGGTKNFYETRIKQRVPSRRFVADMTVAAIRLGHTVRPDEDFYEQPLHLPAEAA